MTQADGSELNRLIRESTLLDPSLRGHWLKVLRHLKPADQERLRAILASQDESTDRGPEPATSQRPSSSAPAGAAHRQ